MFKGPRKGECFALCGKLRSQCGWNKQVKVGGRKRERQAGARLQREDYECYSKCARKSLSSFEAGESIILATD